MEPQTDDEKKADLLGEMSRKIVTTREITPRNPRWHRTWKKTLLRYVDTARRLRRAKADLPEERDA